MNKTERKAKKNQKRTGRYFANINGYYDNHNNHFGAYIFAVV